jgi:CheY-like chemotaxis protein
MAQSKSLVLVIEDDPPAAEALVLLLADWGAQVVHSQNGEEVAAELGPRMNDVRWIITDFHLGGGRDGITVVKRLRAAAPRARVLILSGSFGGRATAEATQAGFDVMQKPARAKSIIEWLERD